MVIAMVLNLCMDMDTELVQLQLQLLLPVEVEVEEDLLQVHHLVLLAHLLLAQVHR